MALKLTRQPDEMVSLKAFCPCIALLLLALAGCDARAPDPRKHDAGLRVGLAENPRDTAVRLVAFSPEDTVRDADSLRLVVALYNGASYREFADDCYAFSYDVIDPTGAPITSAPRPEVFGMCNTFALGQGEFSGFTVPLACPLARTEAERQRSCWWDFRLTRPGPYKLVAHFRASTAPPLAGTRAVRPSLALTSDTAVIEYAPRPKS